MEESGFVPRIDDYLGRLNATIKTLDKKQIDAVIRALLKVYDCEGTVYIFGNGGSAATASHCVCDFNKGISEKQEKKFHFVCLSDNTATMMAIANDNGYDLIFRQQLEGKLGKDDLVFAISGSGNSKNVISAVEYAKSIGTKVISMTGYDGGKLLKMSDYPIHANINDMQIAEDVHMIMCHLLASTIAKHLGHPMC